MSPETATPTGSAPQSPPPSAFNHPRLQEVMKKAATMGGIGQILMQVLYDTVHPADRILGCFYQIDAPTAKPGDPGGAFYSCEVILITSQYFIFVNLFPKSHLYRKRKVFTVGEVSLKYDPPNMDEIKTVQAGKFVPRNLTMSVTFNDDKGNLVETWVSETTHPEAIKNLFDIQRILSKCIGFPLAQVPPQAVGA